MAASSILATLGAVLSRIAATSMSRPLSVLAGILASTLVYAYSTSQLSRKPRDR